MWWDFWNKLSPAGFRLLLLQLMVIQNSAVVLIGRHTRASGVPESELYVVNHLILVCELSKLILSCILESFGSQGKLLHGLKTHVIGAPLDCIKIIIPSLLYLVQNTLLYVALSNLSAPLFQVTYQAKLLTTALVSVVLLQRRYSLKQWICLTALGVGVAIVVLGESETDKKTSKQKNDSQNLFVGLVSVSIACFSSAFAGVYIEMVLKNASSSPSVEHSSSIEPPRPPPSLWMRNIQMAFFSVVIALLQGASLSSNDKKKPFMHGFTFWVWILVIFQAGGGILVAAVIKYADNVLKGLATGVSVVVATLCSMILFNTALSLQFTFGAIMILISVYWFSNDLPPSLGRFFILMFGSTARSMNNKAEINDALLTSQGDNTKATVAEYKKDDERFTAEVEDDIEMQYDGGAQQRKALLTTGHEVKP